MVTFLFTYDASTLARSDLTDLLDTRSEIRNWFAPFHGALLVIAQDWVTVQNIDDVVHNRFPSAVFVVVPIDIGASQGWMPPLFWELVHTPKDSGRWNLLKGMLGAGNPSQ